MKTYSNNYGCSFSFDDEISTEQIKSKLSLFNQKIENLQKIEPHKDVIERNSDEGNIKPLPKIDDLPTAKEVLK